MNFFNEDMHPEDMEFNIVRVGKGGLDQKYYSNLLTAVSSHNNEQNIPGRELKWMVFEKALIRLLDLLDFGSPTINSKPRNIWLGKTTRSFFIQSSCSDGICYCSITTIWI